MRRFIPIIIFLVIGVAFAIALTRDPRKLDSVIIDQPFPDFALTELNNPDAILTPDIVSGQVSLINVFGSWCVTCNVEHPVLMDIAKNEDITLIGINWRDNREKGQEWLSKRGDPYDTIIFDPESLLTIPLGVVGAPETFITDKSGRIRYKHSGAITFQDWNTHLKPLIIKLDAEL